MNPEQVQEVVMQTLRDVMTAGDMVSAQQAPEMPIMPEQMQEMQQMQQMQEMQPTPAQMPQQGQML